MNIFAIIGEALRALRLNRLRTGLTMLGMIIGVAAVVLMLAVGQGAQTTVNQAITSMGSNLFFIVTRCNLFGCAAFGSRRSANIDDSRCASHCQFAIDQSDRSDHNGDRAVELRRQ